MIPGWVPDHGVSCIVLGEGAEWQQQCGGYACLQKTARGVLVSVAGDDAADKLTEHFCGEKWGGWCMDGIDEETACFIESVLEHKFAVSRDRLADDREAWVHGYLDGMPSILVWGNSD